MGNDIKHMIQVQNDLYDEIKEFCDVNELKINVFINELLQKGLMIEKYGDTPFASYVPNVSKPTVTVDGVEYTEEEIIGIIKARNVEMSSPMDFENEDAIIVEGVFQKFDIPNSNGRVYSKDGIEKEVKRFNEAIKNGEPMGELNHPEPEFKPIEVEETPKVQAKKPTKRRLK